MRVISRVRPGDFRGLKSDLSTVELWSADSFVVHIVRQVPSLV